MPGIGLRSRDQTKNENGSDFLKKSEPFSFFILLLAFFSLASVTQAATDTTPPTGTIVINNNNAATNSSRVTLRLFARDNYSGVSQMQLSNDNINWSSPTAYSTYKSWILAGDGAAEKTVYVKFRDRAGNWSGAFSDTIILDTTPPTTPIVNDSGDTTKEANKLSASWASDDPESGITQYQYRITRDSMNGGVVRNWTSTGTTPSVTAAGLYLIDNKTYFFAVKARNALGLWSNIGYSDGIKKLNPDETPPVGTIKINNGNPSVNSKNVTLNLSAADEPGGSGMGYGAQMQFSNDSLNWSTPQAYTISKAWALNGADGTKTVYVKFRDRAGNWSGAFSDGIILDTVPPAGSIKINDDAQWTSSASVNLTLAAADTMSEVAQMRFSNDNRSWSAAEAYRTEKLWNLTRNGSAKTVYVKFKDVAGNWSAAFSDTIILDTARPTGTMSINENAAYTNQTAVQLKFNIYETGSGLAEMCFSNDSRAWSDPEAYAPTKSWMLNGGDGRKTAYAKFKDNAGNWSNIIYDPITLDTAGPQGSIFINNNAAYTNSSRVTLRLSASDTVSGVSQIQLSNDNTEWTPPAAYTSLKAWTLNGGSGTKTVYAKFIDRAGNISGVYSDTIILDTTPPTAPVVTDGGEATVETNRLSASWASDDPESGITQYQYRITRDSLNGAVIRNWASTGTTPSVTATGLYLIDNKTYFFAVKAKNGLGLWSNIGYSDGIMKTGADTIPPTGSIKINNDEAYVNSLGVNLNLSATDAASGMGSGAQMQFSNDNSTWSAAEAYNTSKAWTLNAGDGTKTVYVRFKDVAGNWSSVYSDTIILDMTAPAKPQGLTATSGNAKIDLSWTANSEVDLAGYNIYRYISGVDYVKLNTTLITGNTYQDTGLTNGVTCYYKITAVDHLGNTSPYSEIVSATPAAPADAYEPNNTPATAANYTLGETISATIHPTNDPDWFKFTANKPGLFRVDITNVSSDLFAMVHIYNSSQQDLGGKSGNAGDSIGYELYLPATGLYYIKVTSRGPEFSLSPYTMKAILTPAADDVYESNNAPATAANYNLGDTITAVIYPANDPDWFKFNVTTPGKLKVEVSNVPSDMPAALRIYNSTLEELGYNSGNYGDGFSKEIYVSTTGIYFVKISAREDQFSLRAYNMKTTLTPVASDPYEPNNTPETAANYNLGDTISATIYPTNDPDWFTFTAAKPGLLRVDITNVPNDLFAMVHIFNSDQEDLGGRSGNAGQDITQEVSLPAAGEYFIKMSARGPEFSLSPYAMRGYFSNLWINGASASPGIFSPNNDGTAEVTTIGATLTAAADWTVNIQDASGALKRIYQGTGSSIAQAWDGKDSTGAVVPDGTYTYIIGAHNAADTALQVKGTVIVDATYPDAAVVYPAPNQDLSGVIAIKGIANDLYFDKAYFFYGRGTSPVDWHWMNWASKTEAAAAPLLDWDTKALPSDNYVLKLEVVDKAGNKSVVNVPVNLANIAPDITDLTVSPSPFTPDGIDEDITNDITKIRFKLSDYGFTTVRIYDKDAHVVKTLWNDVLRPDPAKGMVIELNWNGKNDGWQIVRNGEYTVKVITGEGQKEASAAVVVNDQPIFNYYNVAPKAFSPDGDGIDDNTALSFKLSEDSLANIAVYNSGNTLIKTLGTNIPITHEQVYNYAWDGKDNSGQNVYQGGYYFKVDAQALTGSIAIPLRADTFLGYISSIKISRDNFNPHTLENSQILYRLAQDARFNIKIYNAQGALVRNLITEQPRASGEHSETWDGRDNSGSIVPDGFYYFTIEDSISGITSVVYDPSHTGGEDISHSISFAATDCATLNNQPSILTYNLPRPAKINIKVRVSRYSGPAIRVIKYQEATGSGQHQTIWDGRDEFGNLILNQSYLLAVWGYTLMDNAFVITGGRPVISGVAINPVKFNSLPNPYAAGAQSTTGISFNLSQDANVTLDIFDASNNLARRMLDNALKNQGLNSVIWDGKNAAGKILPNGYYRVEIQAEKDGNYSDVATAHTEVFY